MAKSKKRKLENPFVYQGYESPEYFCDRLEETENVLSALRNGRNITLISPRKIGKTGLINHAFYRIKEQESDIICIYIDIFSTNNLLEFVPTKRRHIVNFGANGNIKCRAIVDGIRILTIIVKCSLIQITRFICQ